MTPERYRRVGEICHAALQLKPDRRSDFLDRACAGDSELRREVESLLALQEPAQDFIETPAAEVLARALLSLKISHGGRENTGLPSCSRSAIFRDEEDPMSTKQGDVTLLQDPIAQSLLHSKIPARLAYTWPDGTPRVVPVWFHWDGWEFVIGTPPTAPKVRALPQNPQVALTIDEDSFPPRVLLVRGVARTELVNGMIAEYAEAARRYLGEEQGAVWVEQVKHMFSQIVRVSVRPEWVGIFDFQQRFPSAIERAMRGEAPESGHAR